MTARIPDFILEKRSELLRIAGKHGISNIRLFGSHVRGEENENSDVDLLVHFESSVTGSGFSFLRFKREAETLINKKIDIVLDDGLSPHLAPYILREAISL